MAAHRVPRTEFDQSLRALVGSEHIDKVVDDPADPAFVIIYTEDRFETREIPVTVTHAARLGIQAWDQGGVA